MSTPPTPVMSPCAVLFYEGVSCRFDPHDVWNRDGGWDDTGRHSSQFAGILESAGLMGLYEQQFEQSGLDYQVGCVSGFVC